MNFYFLTLVFTTITLLVFLVLNIHWIRKTGKKTFSKEINTAHIIRHIAIFLILGSLFCLFVGLVPQLFQELSGDFDSLASAKEMIQAEAAATPEQVTAYQNSIKLHKSMITLNITMLSWLLLIAINAILNLILAVAYYKKKKTADKA